MRPEKPRPEYWPKNYIKRRRKDGEGHVLVIRERNTVHVSLLEAADTHSVTATGYKCVCFSLSKVTLQLSGWTASKSEQFTQSGQPLSCRLYLRTFFDLVRWNKIFYKHGSYSIVHSCNITCVSTKILTYMTELLPEHFTKKNMFNRWEVLRQTLRIINYISKSKKYFHKHVTKFLVLNYYRFLDVRALHWIRNGIAIVSVPRSASHSTATNIAFCFNKLYAVY